MIENAVLLCSGEGTRLRPFTEHYNKGLIAVNGKFVIDYPLQTLKELGVKNVVVILGGAFFSQMVAYLKDGQTFGLNITYRFQEKANGIAAAIALAQPCLPPGKFIVLLGDNLFFDGTLNLEPNGDGCQIVLTQHRELERFGVAVLDSRVGLILDIKEKPSTEYLSQHCNTAFHTPYAITGLYVFDQQFWEFFAGTKKSDRGEFEITHIIEHYRKNNQLTYSVFNGKWYDAGTHSSIHQITKEFLSR